MKRKLISVSVLILVASILSAQAPTPPTLAVYPDLTSTVAAGAAISNTLDVMKGNIGTTFVLEQGDKAAITTLQATITTMQAQISTLQSQVKALQNPPIPSFVYALSFSTSSTRTPASNLNGALVSGSIYVFSATAANIMNDSPANVISVSYWIDNPSMTGAALHTENVMPFDMLGSPGPGPGDVLSGPAYPWNSANAANGVHTITQKVTMSGGGVEVDTASFTVAN